METDLIHGFWLHAKLYFSFFGDVETLKNYRDAPMNILGQLRVNRFKMIT